MILLCQSEIKIKNTSDMFILEIMKSMFLKIYPLPVCMFNLNLKLFYEDLDRTRNQLWGKTHL